jgi:hypothetical protein
MTGSMQIMWQQCAGISFLCLKLYEDSALNVSRVSSRCSCPVVRSRAHDKTIGFRAIHQGLGINGQIVHVPTRTFPAFMSAETIDTINIGAKAFMRSGFYAFIFFRCSLKNAMLKAIKRNNGHI